MSIKCDYHIHTIYCDGKNAPEDYVKAAIDKGYSVIGFSGHSYVDFDVEGSMFPENEDKYFNEISALKQKYADKIEILCGIELDCCSKLDTSRFDYVIGSMHYIKQGDSYYALDISAELFRDILNKFYGGDFGALAIDYYKSVSDVVTKTNASIIAHIDLVTKYEKVLGLKKDDRYYEAAFDAIKKLVKFNVPFEINYGIISRGHKDYPYNEDVLLKEINRLGGDIVINSDCHNAEFFGSHHQTAVDIAKRCGFEKQVVFINGKKQYVEL